MIELEHVASNEDGDEWYVREGRFALPALIAYSRMTGYTHWWRHRARRQFMRPLTREDCEAPVHAPDVPDDDDDARDAALDAGCRCYDIEEGWMLVCEAGEPGARPVWKIEDHFGYMPWWLRRRLRALHPLTWRKRRAAVLWGGALDREARWFDRLLLGRGFMLVWGDAWVRPDHVGVRRSKIRRVA